MTITNRVSLKSVMAGNTPIADVPDAPTIGVATGGAELATVTYTAAATGGTATTFTATSSPGSITGTGSSPITVSGLTGGTAYTFTVQASNSTGTSPASAATSPVTPTVATSYESIATVIIDSGGNSTITFSSIPQTYTHLQIRGILKGSRPGPVPGGYAMLRFNSDTGSNYIDHVLASSINASPATPSAWSEGLGTFLYLSAIPGIASAPFFGTFMTDILEYNSTNKNKVIRTIESIETNANTINGYNASSISFKSGLWINSANAITSITIEALGTSSPFKQFSQLALYGIKG